MFIENSLNKFLSDNKAKRCNNLIGASFHIRQKKFRASIKVPLEKRVTKHLGTFNTELEAHKAWQAKKHEYACQLADLQDDLRVADALRQRYSPDKDWTTV